MKLKHAITPPGTKHVFVPAALYLWPNMHVISNGKKTEFPLNSQLQTRNSRGFFPVYETLADLRKDFPRADYTRCIVMAEPTARETMHFDIK